MSGQGNIVFHQDNSPYDRQLSLLVAFLVQSEPYRCWRNAALAVNLLPELFADGGVYVEGWIVLPRVQTIAIIEHGWCQLADGRIVDPSILLVERSTQPIDYFAGFTLSWEQVHHQLPGSTLPLVCHTTFGKDGMHHEGYQRAYAQAWDQARIQAERRLLPETAIVCHPHDSVLYRTVVIQGHE